MSTLINLNLNENIISEARRIAREKGMSLSGFIENYLITMVKEDGKGADGMAHSYARSSETFLQLVNQDANNKAFLENLYQCMDDCFDEFDFGVNRLSEMMGMSRSQLYRKIKSLTGKSVSTFIRKYRLEKGKELLRNTSLNISEVSYQIGYSDPSYFSRAFMSEYGALPKSFRKKRLIIDAE